MLRSSGRWPSRVVGVVTLLVAVEAHAQTAPALPPPPPASPWPTPPQWTAPAPPPPEQSWNNTRLMPPATDDERASQGVRTYAEVPRQQRCADDEAVGRVFAEGVTVLGSIVGVVTLTAFLIQSERDGGAQLLTGVAGLTAYLFIVPALQHAVARNFGGNGQWWASLLGGLLIPVVGHVIGYELSHEPLCNGAQRARLGPHPRLARSSLLDASHGALVAPALAPSPNGGTVGMTVTF